MKYVQSNRKSKLSHLRFSDFLDYNLQIDHECDNDYLGNRLSSN